MPYSPDDDKQVSSREDRSAVNRLGDQPGKRGTGIFESLDFLAMFGGIVGAVGGFLSHDQSVIFMSSTVAVAGIVLYGYGRYLQNRLSQRVERAISETKKAALLDLNPGDIETLARARQILEDKARVDFEQNLRSIIAIDSISARNALMFRRAEWSLQPGVNVILGRNGYGKSFILRILAAAVQADEKAMKSLLSSSDSQSEVSVELRRNAQSTRNRWNSQRFSDSIGKVPLLAIPDSRFLDRSQNRVSLDEIGAIDLQTNGASHFLEQAPYGAVVRTMLYQICLDYWEHGRTFDLPIFEFYNKCVKALTDSEFRFKSIKRQGTVGFEIRVLTEGNPAPAPIQYASQGTLSLLAMLGLIRNFTESRLASKTPASDQKADGIVIIDEADAHLHPLWQQKFPTVLREFFPKVQFILSAHSPLFVAGCWKGEVAVLRRGGDKTRDGFVFEQPDRDFVGVSAGDLYRQVFQIDELDDSFLKYATKATRPDQKKEARLAELLSRQDQQPLASSEEEELACLEEEARRIRRVQEIDAQRMAQMEKQAQLAALEPRKLKDQSMASKA